MKRSRIVWLTVGLLLLIVAFATGWLSAKMGAGSTVNRASLSDRERQFADHMSGVTLVGHFTMRGREGGEGAEERYEISSVEKVGPKDWRFNAHIKFGKVDTTLPLVIPVEWAGDTPMISMTNFAIPSMGTFHTHVLFDGDQYAGTWEHVGRGGGLMFGKIEKTAR